jgi:ubiquinone/menaquinone biosynthesis C-methylase UbiE
LARPTLEKIKEFYKDYDNGWILGDLHYLLAKMLVEDPKVKKVFEFGCGNGKNLMLLKELKDGIIVGGMDISPSAIHRAKVRGLENSVMVGDETKLQFIPKYYYDTAFTVSVLDHLPLDITARVISELKDITMYQIILVEAETEKNEMYWAHDYTEWDFKKLPDNFTSAGDGVKYRFWIWRRNA